MLFAGWEVCIRKNCAQGLEYHLRGEKRDIFMKNGNEGKDVFSDIQGIFGMNYIGVLLIEFQTLQ